MSRYVIRQPKEQFTEKEWKKLKKLADQKGKVYTDAMEFLKDLMRMQAEDKCP